MSMSKTVEQHSQGKRTRNSQHTSSSKATASASDSETNFSAHDIEPELGNPLPNIYPTFFEAPPISKQENDPPPSLSKQENDPPADNYHHDSNFCRSIADDSQSENDDLYLSECRMLLAGLEASELRKLVDMVRRGGGSRFMSFSEKLTHVLVGNPSEMEVKEIRCLAALGVIYVVKATWLQECTLRKREVPVLQCHIAYDLLLPKAATSLTSVKHWKLSGSQPMHENTRGNKTSESQVSSDMKEETKTKVQAGMDNGIANVKSTIFEGMHFCFTTLFPEEQRPEVVTWVNQGGGEVVSDQNGKNVNFIIERHGVMPYLANVVGSIYVTTHWIHSCLKNKVIDLKGFYPKVPTSQDQEGGLYHVSQNPTQSVQAPSVDDASQHSSQFLDIRNMQAVANMGCVEQDVDGYSSSASKKARLLGNDNLKHPLPLVSSTDNSLNKAATENILTDDTREVSCVVPDVAAAIEDLLEQTSKIQDQKSQEARVRHEDFLSSNSTMLCQRPVNPISDPGASKHWMNRTDKKDENLSTEPTIRGIYDGFSETQTDSQVPPLHKLD